MHARPRRGRPPLPQDNATRERLLDAALRLLAARSFATVSVREITEAAGQSVGALNYHFGSKDGLLEALLRRSAPALIGERLRLLEEAEAAGRAGADLPVRLRAVLQALLLPVIRWSREPSTQTLFLPMWHRLRADCPAQLRELMEVDVRHLQPFVDALARLLPAMPRAEIGRRLHFVLGVEHAVVAEQGRLTGLSGDDASRAGADALAERVLDFVVPGWCAPVR